MIPLITAGIGALGSMFSGGGGAPAGPVSSGGGGPISFGSRTLGTGASGGDTDAKGGAGSSVAANGGGNSLPTWLPIAALAMGGVLILGVFAALFRPSSAPRRPRGR